MTHQFAETTDHAQATQANGSGGLAAIGSIVLMLIWGVYTALYLVEVFSMPMPAR